MAGRFLCARAPKCRRGYVGASLCAQSGSGLRVLASRGRAVPRWGGPNWPFAPNGYSRAAKARGPRCASALARSEVWPAGGFGAGGVPARVRVFGFRTTSAPLRRALSALGPRDSGARGGSRGPARRKAPVVVCRAPRCRPNCVARTAKLRHARASAWPEGGKCAALAIQ